MKHMVCFLLGALCYCCLWGQGTVQVEAGTTLKSSDGVYLVLDNMHLVNDGTINQAAGDGTLQFTGSTDVTLGGNGATTLSTLVLAKGAASRLSLQQSLVINHQLSFSTGLLDLGNYNVVLQSPALLAGESEGSRALTTGTGYIEAQAVLNNPAAYNVGNLGASITSSASLGNVVVRRGHCSQVNSYGNGSSLLRYYDILPTSNTGLDATVRLAYLDAELNGLPEASLHMWQSPNNTTWTNIGFDARSTAANYVEKAGLNSLVRFTLSAADNVLPVTYTLFHAACKSGAVELSWKTGRETNSSRFAIERSTDGRIWTVIGTLPAAGNTDSERAYAFTDAAAISNALYRVVETDETGRKTYTSVIRSACESREAFGVYPNPVRSEAIVKVVAESAFRMNLALYDAQGRLVATRAEAMLPGVNHIAIPLAHLPAGSYTLLTTGFNGQAKAVKLSKL